MNSDLKHPEIQGVSIVALGDFNPAIFQPLWFSANNLLREEEANEAKVDIVHREATVFKTEWLTLQVTSGRYSVETLDPTMYQPLRDLALGTFGILEHTPIHAVGFNMNQHFRMPSEDAWNAFGDHYTQKDSWRGILTQPGMRTLVIEGKRDNCNANQIQVKIEPSRKAKHGVFIGVNEHYDVRSSEDSSPADRMEVLLKTLRDAWDEFLSYCGDVASHLFSEYERRATQS